MAAQGLLGPCARDWRTAKTLWLTAQFSLSVSSRLLLVRLFPLSRGVRESVAASLQSLPHPRCMGSLPSFGPGIQYAGSVNAAIHLSHHRGASCAYPLEISIYLYSISSITRRITTKQMIDDEIDRFWNGIRISNPNTLEEYFFIQRERERERERERTVSERTLAESIRRPCERMGRSDISAIQVAPMTQGKRYRSCVWAQQANARL